MDEVHGVLSDGTMRYLLVPRLRTSLCMLPGPGVLPSNFKLSVYKSSFLDLHLAKIAMVLWKRL